MNVDARDRAPIPALTSLRFFAAFYVVAFHGMETTFASPVLRSFLSTGYVAVDFFFVLSGFVLAYNYVGAEGGLAVKRWSFWAARFARIYPAYFVSLVLGAPMYLSALRLTHSIPSTAVLAAVSGLAALTLVQSWIYRLAGSWNPPAWSLSVEAFLYAVFPFAVPFTVRSARRFGPLVIGVVLWAAALAAPLGYVLLGPDHLTTVTNHSDGKYLLILKYLPAAHVPSMLLGALAGWWYVHHHGRFPKALVWVAALALLVALCMGQWLPYPLLHNGLLAPLFVVVIVGATRSEGLIGRALASPTLVLLGDASYSLYLLHYPLLVYTQRLVGEDMSLATFLVFAGLTQLLAILTYKVIEVPTRRTLRRRLAALQAAEKPQ